MPALRLSYGAPVTHNSVLSPRLPGFLLGGLLVLLFACLPSTYGAGHLEHLEHHGHLKAAPHAVASLDETAASEAPIPYHGRDCGLPARGPHPAPQPLPSGAPLAALTIAFAMTAARSRVGLNARERPRRRSTAQEWLTRVCRWRI